MTLSCATTKSNAYHHLPTFNCGTIIVSSTITKPLSLNVQYSLKNVCVIQLLAAIHYQDMMIINCVTQAQSISPLAFIMSTGF